VRGRGCLDYPARMFSRRATPRRRPLGWISAGLLGLCGAVPLAAPPASAQLSRTSACPIDRCSGATETGASTVTPDRCIIGGESVASGVTHPAYPCLFCDPARDERDWSARPEGTSCGEASCVGGWLTTGASCSSRGACTTDVPTRCAGGYCEDPTRCATTCAGDGCPGASFCAPSRICELLRANASSCGGDAECESGHCVDGICCGDACAEPCESCVVPGSIGTCAIVPAMTDPDGECGPLGYCDGVGSCVGGDDPHAATSVGDHDAGRSPDAATGAHAGLNRRPSAGGLACSASRPGSEARVLVWAAFSLGLFASVRRRRRP